VPAHLPARTPNAVGHLMGSLLLSGLAMTLAGTSAPSSGGEHLISHYLDMTHYAFGDANDLHGCQVGVATLTTAALYEKLSTFDPAAIDIEACTAAHNTWEAHSAVLDQRFTTLASAVKPHAKEKYPTTSQLRQRLNFLKDNWREIIPHITAPLRTTTQIRAQLEAAQAPTTFAAVGATAPRARRAITHSKDIRARYTILHLLAELGLLEEWSEDILRVQKLLGA
jgi:glycerol-1-phosphate dehydrogenase [NAD(P)+]